ncbi:MAG: hypothetical protein CML24_14625 [Rhizobiales bacterium]|nr:hypothetical protein [Hyphomicrobiales bacterium]
MIGSLALGGCQTTAEYEAQQTATLHDKLFSYRGQTVGDLLRDQPAFSTSGYEEISADRRMYFIESEPVISTVYIPPYTPAAGSFNNAAIARAARNVATMNTVPGVARSTTRYCRLHVDAERIDDEASPDSWRIRNVDYSGTNC